MLVRVGPNLLYPPDPSNPALEIVSSIYGNFAIVSAGPFDLWIDILQMPGEPRDGRLVIKSNRVFLSRRVAKILVNALSGALAQSPPKATKESDVPASG